MENQASSKSIIINNGLILGIIGIVIHLALWASGKLIDLNWLNTVVWIVALILLLIAGIKKFKEANGGFMSWGQGVKIGMGIAMISAIITLIYTFLFMNVIDPEFQQQAMEIQQQALVDAGYTEEQIEASIEMGKKFQSPGILSAVILVWFAFLGFIVSAITSAVMKKNEEEAY